LAAEFLRTGDNVVVSSRSEERVRSTVRDLEQLQTGASVAGIAANVSKPNDVAALAKFASTQLGTVDLWCAIMRGWQADGCTKEVILRGGGLGACRINNAGSNAYSYGPLANATDADLLNIVETNVLGVMLCCREVLCIG
jgi:chlorophyll(ide) b reductase